MKTEKPAGRCDEFLGRAAVLKKKDQGLTHRLVQFRLNAPEPLLDHNELIWRDGRITGQLTSSN